MLEEADYMLFEFGMRHLILLLFFAVLITESRNFEKKIWKKRTITWKFDDPFELLSQRQKNIVSELAENAFDEWKYALEGLLKIKKLEENSKIPADININFAKKNHSCIESFDGRGGVVAHSTYPTNGILHLDADELWHTGDQTKGEVDLRYVLIHEIGHVLGLRHSRRKNSVMRRNYRKSTKSFKLSKYDVRAIRKLYTFN
ncbi:unnamed protein product [Caenorhabditis angaria]|uniref:Peptidase metallopeptidase domain-containing protein n=1 Tax=Caenorhabditis angaria TaxID=860376 RepID=A0A9P1N1Q3_9PELO|nr:unnamed protein product [Caenorhabditis angaria]